jgi:hypothetical protein
MNEYKHVIFNPVIEGAFQKVIADVDSSWSLSHVVHHSQWEAVAVFERWVSDAVTGG